MWHHLFRIVMMAVVALIPGCCWNNCLKKCNPCNDCGVIYEPSKPRRYDKEVMPEFIQEEEEEEIIEE